jgi:hypothetical protein
MTDAAAVAGGAPAAAPLADGGAAPAQAAPWFGTDAPDDIKSFVQNKGWDSPLKAITSYRELESMRGVPADRLLKLPEKADDPSWSEIRAKVGWKAPDKPEDYGVTVPDGSPPEYAAAITQAAHKLGVPKDTLLALAAENQKFVEAQAAAQDKAITERIAAADAAFAEKFGAKAPEISERIQREASRLGLDAGTIETIEGALALSSEDGVGKFRSLLADLAQARTEAPLHNGATQQMASTPQQAQAKLDQLTKNPEWAKKAVERGTAEAEERLTLIALASGKMPDAAEISRQAKAIWGTV